MAGPTPCKGCGKPILFERQDDGKWLVSEWDETNFRKGERHNCPNYQPKQPKQQQGQQWTTSNKQGGQFTQYKIQEGLDYATKANQELILKRIKDIEILMHTIGEELKTLHNNVIAHLVEKGEVGNDESFYDSQQAGKKSEQDNKQWKNTEQFGEKGENAMSDEVYDY